MKSFFKWSGIFSGLIAVLIAVFYAIENYRGAEVWEETKAYLESEGETLEFADLIPPLPPDDENFCATPLIASMTNFKGGGDDPLVYLDPNRHDRILAMKLPGDMPAKNRPAVANLKTGQLPEFEKWAEIFADSSDFDAGPGALAAAERVVKALSKFDPEVEEMAEAVKRKYAIWKFQWSEDAVDRFAQALPHYYEAIALVRLLSLRSTALLETGDSAGARQSLAIMLRLAEAMDNTSGGLLSEMVAETIRIIFLNTVWFGLKTDRWMDADLAWLAEKLAGVDLYQPALLAFRSEVTTAQIGVMDHLKNASIGDAAGAFSLDRVTDGSLIGGLTLMLCPDGWWDRNKSEGCRMVYEQAIVPLRKRDLTSIGPATFLYTGKRPYSALLELSLPTCRTMLEKIAEGIFYHDAARVAVALERFRKAKGAYPKDLKDLVPEFLDAVPSDPMDGTPLKFLPGENGRFRIYSIGLDRFDDGGEVVFRLGGRTPNREVGDWVWGYEFPEREEALP